MHVCLAAVRAIILVCQHHRHRLITPATALGLQPASEGVAATPRAVAAPIEGPQLQVTWVTSARLPRRSRARTSKAAGR